MNITRVVHIDTIRSSWFIVSGGAVLGRIWYFCVRMGPVLGRAVVKYLMLKSWIGLEGLGCGWLFYDSRGVVYC